MTQSKQLVYIVEQNSYDQCLLQQAFSNSQLAASLHFFTSGAELFIRLTHRLDGKLPDLIILNELSPIMNGFETHQLLEQSKEYRNIPVLMLRTLEQITLINPQYDPLTGQTCLTTTRQFLIIFPVVSPPNLVAYSALIKGIKLNRITTKVLLTSVSFTNCN